MIVLDEQICIPELRNAISHWYPGKVAYITDLRPDTHIDDVEIPAILLKVKQPTFVTINYKDFWRKINVHRDYCIICILLEPRYWRQVNPIVRDLLSLPEFKNKKDRMGTMISYRDGVVKWNQL
ncbi:MAG: hypothetical protein J2P21_32230 [Chloracidobacterium sp.]|nr:hypothetical protein [Chloracidobacterium sp.]